MLQTGSPFGSWWFLYALITFITGTLQVHRTAAGGLSIGAGGLITSTVVDMI